MNGSKTAKVFRVLAGAIFSFSVALSSCQFEPTTLVPTRTPTLTPQSCPPIIINTPDGLGFRKTVFVVLIQPNPHYEYTVRALEVINYVFPRVIEPGDTFYMLRMGIFEPFFNNALLSHGDLENIPQPAIPATPTFMPTVTATNMPISTPQSGVSQKGATAQAEQTIVALNATATNSEFLHNCAMQEWIKQYQQQAANWESTKSAARSNFILQVQNDTNIYQQQSNASSTALPNMIHESMEHATLVFDNFNCGADDRCFLIVFSDLNDPRYPTPEYIHANMIGVKVISVMFNCDPIFQPTCKTVQDRWVENFKGYNASVPPEYINGNNIENNLIEILIRR